MMDIFPNRAMDYPGAAPSTCLRVGTVSSVDPATATVRVLFDDRHDLVSKPLPVLFRSVGQSPEYLLPGVGEPVVCMFLGNGIEEGFVLGAYYNRQFTPPESGAVIYNRCANGAEIRYHTDSGAIDIDSPAAVNITAASGVNIHGDVTVTGKVTASGDVTGNGHSLSTHKHAGVQAGGAMTGTPVG